MSLQLYQVDSRTYLLDFRSIDGTFESVPLKKKNTENVMVFLRLHIYKNNQILGVRKAVLAVSFVTC